MSLASMLRHTCSTSRNVPVGTNGAKSMTAHLTGVRCAFFPMSAQAAVSAKFDVGYSWNVYFENGADIKVTDRLTWNGVNYVVRGIQPYAQFGHMSYLHALVVTEQANAQ